MRSEAQKRADKKYRENNKDKYKIWGTSFTQEEHEYFNSIIKQKGISKADFIRQAIEKLKNEK